MKTPSNTLRNHKKKDLDRRLGMRRRTLVLVEIHGWSDRPQIGIMYNFSSGGMFIVCNASLYGNRCVDVVVPVVGATISFPGLVIYRRNYGIGLMFLQLDSAAQAFVKKYFD